MILPFR